MEHFSKYFEVTGNRFNNWFIEKIKQSRNVDMEDEEDWWKLWERLF